MPPIECVKFPNPSTVLLFFLSVTHCLKWFYQTCCGKMDLFKTTLTTRVVSCFMQSTEEIYAHFPLKEFLTVSFTEKVTEEVKLIFTNLNKKEVQLQFMLVHLCFNRKYLSFLSRLPQPQGKHFAKLS